MALGQFCISRPMGKLICLTQGLIYKGAILAYDLINNGTEWIQVWTTTQDLSRAEEALALALCQLVPHILDAQSVRLNRFGEDRNADIAGGEGSGECHSDNNEEEDTTHSQENPEGSTHESDLEDKEDNSQWGDLHDKSEGGTNTPWQPGSSPSCHPTDKHMHSHSRSWGSKCESKGVEDDDRVTTQEDVTEESSSGRENNSEGDTDDEDASGELSQTSPLTSQESEELPVSVLVGAEPTTGETGYGAPRRS